MRREARFSRDEVYRYSLSRVWDDALPQIGFIMLNPSTADATRDDPTIRRCIGFARAWGFGGLQVVNLFAYRATRPAQLFAVADPVGRENDRFLQRLVASADMIVAGWGADPRARSRADDVMQLLGARSLQCLGETLAGAPKHPLYIRKDARPAPYLLVRNDHLLRTRARIVSARQPHGRGHGTRRATSPSPG